MPGYGISSEDFQAAEDAHTLIRAKEIEQNPGRMRAAKGYAEQQRDDFDAMAQQLPGSPRKRMDGSPDKSRMGPK